MVPFAVMFSDTSDINNFEIMLAGLVVEIDTIVLSLRDF